MPPPSPRPFATPRPKAPSHNSSPKLSVSTLSFSSSSTSPNPWSPFSSTGSPQTMSGLRGTRGKTKHPHRYPILWICMVLMMGFINVVYQWYTKDDWSDFNALLHLTGPSSNSHNQQQPQPSSRQLDWKAPSLSIGLPHTVAEFPFAKPTSPETTAVFYHVYLPPTQEGRQNSKRIIQEQLQQLASSDNPNYTLYYNTIGEITPDLNTEHIQQLCKDQGIQCHAMHNYQEGMEDKTLQRLHDFCSVTGSEDYAVVYLHNKGSFSVKPINEAWRYQMTQAIVSPECQKHTTNAPDQCNLCGLYFSAERGLFMAGNMWRTRCSYVKNLLPPSEFQFAMHTVTAQALLERLRYRFTMTLQELRAGVFGIDRFATEFWIASHPFVRPCDFSKAITRPTIYDMTEIFLRWLRKKVELDDYKTALESSWFVESAPYHPLPLTKDLEVAQYPDVRLREYFLMAGNLFRWYGLYGQAPPISPTSWAYRWFPDGEKWKAAVQDHGKDSVTFVTDQALQMEVHSGRNKYTKDNSKQKIGQGPGSLAQRANKKGRVFLGNKKKSGAGAATKNSQGGAATTAT